MLNRKHLGALAATLLLLSFSSLVFLKLGTSLRDEELSAPNDPEVNELISQARSLQRLGKWPEAVEILQPLATKGHPIAIYHLARAYKNGWGVSPDLETARDWFKKGVRYDFPYRGETAYEIGRLYQQSSGDDCNTIAVAWFHKALAWKFEKAHVQLAYHYRYGLGVDQDRGQVGIAASFQPQKEKTGLGSDVHPDLVSNHQAVTPLKTLLV